MAVIKLKKRLIARGDAYLALCRESMNVFPNVLNSEYMNGVYDGLQKAMEIIAGLSDAEPDRGAWKQDELSRRLGLYVCSECGQPLQIVDADGGKTATAYCPNCGAKMEGENG